MTDVPSFQLFRESEEVVHYYVNGVPVALADHEDHGWDGMEEIESMFYNVALALSVTVETLDAALPDEDEDDA